MGNLERLNELIAFIEMRIRPYSLNESGKVTISNLLRRFPYELLEECVDISYEHYIRRDENGDLIKESVEVFFNKIGGIAYNQSLSPIEKAMAHVLNSAKKNHSYWNSRMAKELLEDYVEMLRIREWSEEKIVDFLDFTHQREL